MVKAVVDTTQERQFFGSRSVIKRPRKAPKMDPETPLAPPSGAKRRGRRGNAFQNSRGGARLDLDGLNVRSNWEANVIRVLRIYQIHYEFEPHKFEFPPNPKNGRINSYLPDIYLPDTGEYIEVKGYLDAPGRNKLRRFKKYYPDEFAKLTVVISKNNKANRYFFNKLGVAHILYYENIAALYAPKVNWEGAR